MERTKPKESTTQVPRPKKKYQNHVGEVYRNVINGLMRPMEEEFRAAGCSLQTLRFICDSWFQKVNASNAVGNFLSPDLRPRGSFSAGERAEAIAKRDIAVAQERMACSKFLMVGDDSKTKPAVTSEGAIVQVPGNKKENDSGGNKEENHSGGDEEQNDCGGDEEKNDSDGGGNEEENDIGKDSSVVTDKAEWIFPPDSGNLDPNHLVLVTLKIPSRTHASREVRSRQFKIRLPAMYVDHKKLNSILNNQLVKQLSELPVSAANACIQQHLQSFIVSEKYPQKFMNLSKQLDGDPDDNLDEYMGFVKTFYENDKDSDSGSSSSIDDDDDDVDDDQEDYDADNDDIYQHNNKKLSRKSKDYLKKLFYLCSDSSSESSTDSENDNDESDKDKCDVNYGKNEDKFLSKPNGNKNSSGHKKTDHCIKSDDEDDEKFIDPPKEKKLKIDASACQGSKNCEVNNKEDEGDLSEFLDIDDEEVADNPDEDPLNSDDDTDSSDSINETSDVCICLFNVVKRTKKNWRIELRSGILNIRGDDYAFNSANVVTKW